MRIWQEEATWICERPVGDRKSVRSSESARQEIECVSNKLSGDAKSMMFQICNFFCVLHTLLRFAAAAIHLTPLSRALFPIHCLITLLTLVFFTV